MQFNLSNIHPKLHHRKWRKLRITLPVNMHALFSACSLRDDNVITIKPTRKLKHTDSFLEYFEYFCQMSSKSMLIILRHTVSKSVRFSETQCIVAVTGHRRMTDRRVIVPMYSQYWVLVLPRVSWVIVHCRRPTDACTYVDLCVCQSVGLFNNTREHFEIRVKNSMMESTAWSLGQNDQNVTNNCPFKGEGGRTPVGLRRGAHLPDVGRWARRRIDHWVCDAWPVRRQTYGYLPSCRASPPFGRYQIILRGDRGTWMWTTCPELLLGSGLAGSRTRDLSITNPTP